MGVHSKGICQGMVKVSVLEMRVSGSVCRHASPASHISSVRMDEAANLAT